MTILTAAQQRELDAYTIAKEPISSFNLMERAAQELYYKAKWRMKGEGSCLIICGPGNNGGDGLLLAALLAKDPDMTKFPFTVWSVRCGNQSADNAKALEALSRSKKVKVIQISEASQMVAPEPRTLVIDALFGTGLTRPLTGMAADVVRAMNTWGEPIQSIDLPSGMMAEDNSKNDLTAVVRADQIYTIHAPKLAFVLPEAGQFAGKWMTVDIGLLEAESGMGLPYRFIDAELLKGLLPPRPRFSHKGTFGHALVMAGSAGKMGAARLCARAALRSGAGLVTASVPRDGVGIMQTGEPEVMCLIDAESGHLTQLPDITPFNAVACGPGIGTEKATSALLRLLIQECKVPMVLDADALNILGENRTWLHFLPRGTVLTPHPKEFDRMFGKQNSSYIRLQTQREQAIRLGVVIVLKGAYTSVALPDGTVHFNTTGNPGMATAGTGDVLTGIITGLLAQGLNSGAASIYAVYLHGLAGDLAIPEQSEQSLIASDLFNRFGQAFKRING